MIAHRLMDARDEKFIVDSWVKSYRESDYVGLIQYCDYFAIMLDQIAKLIALPSVRVIVAYDPTETDRIADINGWICTERSERHNVDLLYYVFVKSAYRGRGIARGLFAASELDAAPSFAYVCRTSVVDDLEKAHLVPRGARFAPILGRH